MNKRTNKHRRFDTMGQCSAVLGISKETLSTLKAEGCPAFRGSRVYEKELVEWIRTRTPANGERSDCPPNLVDRWESMNRAELALGCSNLLLAHPKRDLIYKHMLAIAKHSKAIAIAIGARKESDWGPYPEDESED